MPLAAGPGHRGSCRRGEGERQGRGDEDGDEDEDEDEDEDGEDGLKERGGSDDGREGGVSSPREVPAMASFEYSDEQQALVQTARDFTRKEIVPVAGHLDEEGIFPREICEKAWETGLMNVEIPEAYGAPASTRPWPGTCSARCRS